MFGKRRGSKEDRERAAAFSRELDPVVDAHVTELRDGTSVPDSWDVHAYTSSGLAISLTADLDVDESAPRVWVVHVRDSADMSTKEIRRFASFAEAGVWMFRRMREDALTFDGRARF